MTTPNHNDPPLVIHLNGPGWRAELVVAAPDDEPWRTVDFDVPLSTAPHAPREVISAEVRYTVAENTLGTGWDRWHVKVYRCRSVGEADALRRYLGDQAGHIQQANGILPGPNRIPIDPPWSVVPVHIVRCDGEHQTVGPVRTELAATPAEISSRVRRALPAWLSDTPPAPERYLLAISPFMDRLNWAGYHSAPATEHLHDFVNMAAGLDALHRLDTVHCDIKPDNVCRYNTHQVSGFVLIDTDSVTPVYPPPRSLRPTKPYHYKGITDWFDNPRVRHLGLEAGVLKAHDRFGLAVVVLTALAGKEWVDRVLLRAPDSAPPRPGHGDRTATNQVSGHRTADDRAAVAGALRQLWWDTDDRRWAPLIQALIEPFGSEIEVDNWSASRWIQRVLEAERECVVEETPVSPFPAVDQAGYARELEGIRGLIKAPETRPKLMPQQGYQAIQQMAYTVARRAAVARLVAWSCGVAAITFVLFFTAFR